MASSHGRSLLAVVCLRVHARHVLARRRGGGVGVSELWRSAAAAQPAEPFAAAALAQAAAAAEPFAAALAQAAAAAEPFAAAAA